MLYYGHGNTFERSNAMSEENPTRLEKIIWQIPDVRDRTAIAAAIFMAMDNRELFTKHAGTYGMECLDRIMGEVS
jgi:hypothetical protein